MQASTAEADIQNSRCARCGWRIVHNHGTGAFGEPAKHGVSKVASVGARGSAGLPEIHSQTAAPLAVVVNEFFDIGGLVQLAQQEVMEHGVMQDHDPRMLQS